MPDQNETDNETTTNEEDGVPAVSEDTPTTQGSIADGIGQNDPKKNRKLAELKMSEPLRDLLTFEFMLPGIYPGVKTNQFMWVPVQDSFYDDMYCDVMEEIGACKFNRYSPFEKGKFYISKKKWEYDIENGVKTSFTVNPFPSMYSEYMKMQLEAERALDQAIIDATKGKRGGGLVNATGQDCNPEDTTESDTWADHRCNPPRCTEKSKAVHGNSSRTYATDTAPHNTSSKDLVEFVKSKVSYEYVNGAAYGDNPKEYGGVAMGEQRCPEAIWTTAHKGNCANLARLLKCILDVNGYQSIICHIPGHFYNAIWENGGWTVCDLCNSNPYGHANHGDIKPEGTWDSPLPRLWY